MITPSNTVTEKPMSVFPAQVSNHTEASPTPKTHTLSQSYRPHCYGLNVFLSPKSTY